MPTGKIPKSTKIPGKREGGGGAPKVGQDPDGNKKGGGKKK